MKVEEGRFYKAKEYAHGKKTPGGYLYVAEITGNSVKWAPVARPDGTGLTGGVFVTTIADFEEMIQ